MRDPLLAPLAAIATGILLSRLVAFETRELGAVIAAYVILALVCLGRQARVLAWASTLLALVAAGALVAVAHRMPPAPQMDTEGALLILKGCVVEPSAISADRDQFVLELEPGARVRVSLFVPEGKQPPVLRYGQRVEFDARVRPTHNFNNPGEFDYVNYLARQGIYWTASARATAPVQILPGRCGWRLMSAIYWLRTASLDRLERLYANQRYETGMMQGILIGETAKLDKVWTEQYRSSGTFHALVISGAHVAVLAAFLLFLLRICFIPPATAQLLTVLASWLYALVTGWQAPVVRSAAGFSLFMIGRLFYRESRIMNLLAAVAIGFLVLDPEQIFEASFQLSFLAVAFIAAFAVPLVERTSGPLRKGLADLGDGDRGLSLEPRAAQFRVEMRLLAETLHVWARAPMKYCFMSVAFVARVIFYFYELMLTSAMIQVGLALPMAVYFHRVSFSGLSANAIIVPLLGLVVPVGFVAVFTGWNVPAKIAGWLLALSQSAAAWHAHWEPAWRIPSPPIWLAVGISAALIAVALLGPLQGRPVWRILRVASVTALVALLALMVWHPFAPRVHPGALEMTAIDVGQGDSIFLALPAGKLMLVDAGGIASFGKRVRRTNLNIGEDVVSPYLWSRSIRRLDVVALSHAHDDHMGGLAAVLENFHVKELWTGATPDSPGWEAVRRKAEQLHVRIVPLVQGRPFDYGGARFEVLAPAPDYLPAAAPRNNDSLVMRLTYGRRSLMLSGDMEKQIEGQLVSANGVEHTDVLKVAHHGSKTSTTEPFLQAVHPAFAVISAGFENLYGHPHEDVIQRLKHANIEIFRTDRMGAITVCTDGQHVQAEAVTGF
ncbi:MAG TPA: DNA internalization-related competence protein ComEC/Rec2 [Bryobacteraceae bacterium]|nr:DNA internalization-related competence protein ComEC/Rec2 [Bryobacteraceae bacterium]